MLFICFVVCKLWSSPLPDGLTFSRQRVATTHLSTNSLTHSYRYSIKAIDTNYHRTDQTVSVRWIRLFVCLSVRKHYCSQRPWLFAVSLDHFGNFFLIQIFAILFVFLSHFALNVQAVGMFLGEFSCLFVFYMLLWHDRRRPEPRMNPGQSFNPLLFFAPAMCDMTATSTMYVGKWVPGLCLATGPKWLCFHAHEFSWVIIVGLSQSFEFLKCHVNTLARRW